MSTRILLECVLSLGLCVAAASAQSPSPKTGYAPVNGIRMYYEIHGDKGDVLVLIHGGGSTIGTSFGRILPLLATDFRVVAVETQAHGHTTDRNAPESFEQDADDVAALMRYLKISKASIFGFSNGGNDAMQIALRHPELVDKLVLASSFYKREGMIPGFFDGMKQATLDVMPRILKEAFLKINPDTTKLMAMFTKDRGRMMRFSDWSDDALRSINAPTLIINGDRDVVLASHAAAMAGLIPQSRLMILPATHGEYIGVAEGPDPGSKVIELVSGIVKDFLRKQ